MYHALGVLCKVVLPGIAYFSMERDNICKLGERSNDAIVNSGKTRYTGRLLVPKVFVP